MIFGSNKRLPTAQEIELATEFAYLVEAIGEVEIGLGLPESILPIERSVLREIIARLSLHASINRSLRSDDLPKLYGTLSMFFPDEIFARIRAARSRIDEVNDESLLSDSEIAEAEEVLQLLAAAVLDATNARSALRAHATRLPD